MKLGLGKKSTQANRRRFSKIFSRYYDSLWRLGKSTYSGCNFLISNPLYWSLLISVVNKLIYISHFSRLLLYNLTLTVKCTWPLLTFTEHSIQDFIHSRCGGSRSCCRIGSSIQRHRRTRWHSMHLVHWEWFHFSIGGTNKVINVNMIRTFDRTLKRNHKKRRSCFWPKLPIKC